MGINPTPTVAECCKRLSISGLHRILGSGCASEINAEIRSFDRPDGHQGRPCKYIGAAALTIVLFVLFVRNMFVCRSTNSTNFTVTRHPLLINKSFLRLAEYRFICVSRTERGLYPFTRIMSQCLNIFTPFQNISFRLAKRSISAPETVRFATLNDMYL